MKTTLSVIMAIVLFTIAFNACTSISTSKGIGIEDYSFARSDENGQLIKLEDPAVFRKGEDVHMILFNVGPFKKDSTDLNWFEMDMEVTGPDGNVVISKTGLLGDAGHIQLENDRASSPYATCYSTSGLASGKYQFKVSVYDKIGTGKATQTATFTLE